MDVSKVEAGEVTLDGQPLGLYPYATPFDSITTVEMEAIPSDGWWFDQWTGDLTGTDNPRDVNVNCDINVTANFIQASYTSISSAEAKAMIDAGGNDLIVIDVREDYEYCNSDGHIPGSLNYPWTSGVLSDRYTELPMESDILVVCRSGNRSKDAASFLAGKGYRNIYEIGGMNDWEWETMTCDNNPPEAKAGQDQTVSEGDTVTLDGSASTGNTALTYAWVQTSGPVVLLNTPESAVASFTAPDTSNGPVSLEFELTVTTENSLQATDSVIVTIIKNDPPPEAKAGQDQSVSEGDTVILDGSASTGDTALAYAWVQTSGPVVLLNNSESAVASFTAPDTGNGSVSLVFELTVTAENSLQDTDSVIVTIIKNDYPPEANAGSDQTAFEAVPVQLDASGSTDSDGTISGYVWRQSSGPAVILHGSDTATPDFMTPPVEAGADSLLSFEVTVTDDSGLQASDMVSVTVIDNGIAGFAPNVYTFQASTIQDMGVSITNGVFIELGPFDTTGIDMNPAPEDLTYGLVDTVVMVTDKAGPITIHFHLPQPAPDDYAWYKYDTDGVGYIIPAAAADGEEGVRFSADRKTVSFTLIDNGDYDLDPTDGIIRDPSGLDVDPDYVTPNVPGGGGGGGGGGCFLSILPL